MHVFEWDRKVAWSIVKAFDENVVLRMLTFISWDRAVCALLHAYKASVSFQSRPTARHALLMLYLETEVSSPVRWASRVAFSSVAQLCPTLCDPMNRGGFTGKESADQYRRCKRLGFSPWVGRIPWKRAWQPAEVFLPGESYRQRSLAGYSPRGRGVGHD